MMDEQYVTIMQEMALIQQQVFIEKTVAKCMQNLKVGVSTYSKEYAYEDITIQFIYVGDKYYMHFAEEVHDPSYCNDCYNNPRPTDDEERRADKLWFELHDSINATLVKCINDSDFKCEVSIEEECYEYRRGKLSNFYGHISVSYKSKYD